MEEYTANLEAICNHIRGRADSCIVVTPPPIDDAARLRYIQAEHDPTATQPDRNHALTAAYAAACREWAEKHKLVCFDAHSHFLATRDWQTLLCDGLHFSPRGNEVFFDGLLGVLEETWILRDTPLQEMVPDAPWNEHIDGLGDWENGIAEWYSCRCSS